MVAGRDAEVAELRSVLSDALGGRGRAVVLVGEAGIGKSTVAEEVAAAAVELGGAVGWARCVEIGGAPPFWPWTQLLRGIASHDERTTPGRAGPLSPLLGDGTGAATEGVGVDDGNFRLFDAVARALEEAARRRPHLFVLEDCHAADLASLQLLHFVIRNGAGRVPWMFLVTQRGVPSSVGRGALLAEVRAASTTIELQGLDVDGVAMLLEGQLGEPVDAQLASKVHDATAGNPLFTIALARSLRREGFDALAAGDPVPLPDSVRGVLAPRLAQLDDSTLRKLALLAASGRAVDRARGGRLLGGDFDTVVEVGVREGWLETTSAGARFAHALIRAAVLEQLAPSDRQAVHLAVAEALEREKGGASHYAALAHHFRLAGRDQLLRAWDYSRKAGDHARRMGALADAAAHYTDALDSGAGSPSDRCRLLIASGSCRIRSGELDRGRAECKEAWELAWTLDEPLLVGEAALAFATFGQGGIVSEEIVRLITGALSRIGTADAGLRARLRARLASEITDPPSTARRELLACEAAEEALATGDPYVILPALRHAQSAAALPDNVDRCLAWTTAAVEAAEATGDHAGRAEVLAYRTIHMLVKGDIDGYRADVSRLVQLAEEAPTPLARWLVTVAAGCRSLLAGRFDDAEATIAESLTFATSVPNALGSWQFQDFSLAWERGDDLSRFEPVLNIVLATRPALALMARSAIVLVQATSGRDHEAEVALVELSAQLDELRAPWTWLVGVGWLAEAAVLLQNAHAASILHSTLDRYRDLHIVGGSGTVAAYWGTVRRHLANLDLLLGRVDAAVEHAQAALAAHVHVGSVPFTVRSQLELARALQRRGATGDAARARALFSEGAAATERIGMQALLRQALREDHGDVAVAHRPVASRDPALVHEGDYWTFSYRGSVVRVRHTKGVQHLAALLREPGREILALDLAAAGRGDIDLANTTAAPVLDDVARGQYRRRLAELEEELASTERTDVTRLKMLQDEWDFLVEELKSATGIGARVRRLGTSPGEAARIAVTKAIRSVLKKVEAGHPELGRHFKVTIRTGTFCAYIPDGQECETWHVEGA